jgi:Tol biopolymer transport system component
VTTQPTWFDRGGKPLGSVADAGEYVHLSLAPDDRRVVLERLDPKTGDGILWLHDLDRNITSRFSLDPVWSWSPIWSPDGAHVVFASAQQGVAGLFVKAASGAGDQTRVLAAPQILTNPSDWSPDGRLILYTGSVPGRGPDIWAVPMSGDRKPFPVLQTEFSETEARASPNGGWLAYSSNESGRTEVYVRSFPATGTQAADFPMAEAASQSGGAMERNCSISRMTER